MPHTLLLLLLQLPTLCSSCKRPGSCYLSLPSPPHRLPPCHTLVYCSGAQQAASAGTACPTCPMQHTCNRCGCVAIEAENGTKRRKKAMGQLATCHLPLERRQGSCCTLVCLAIESALSYLPKGEQGGAGRGCGRLNRCIPPLATRLSRRQF